MRPNWVWPSPQPITPAAVAAEKQAASLTAPCLAPPIISIHFLVQSSILLGHVQVGGVGCLSVDVRGWGQGDRGRTKYRRPCWVRCVMPQTSEQPQKEQRQAPEADAERVSYEGWTTWNTSFQLALGLCTIPSKPQAAIRYSPPDAQPSCCLLDKTT